MTDNNFHLAAALMADAADLIDTASLGTTIVDDHAYGHLPLAATHTIDDDGTHTLTLWSADDDSLTAAVQADRPAGTDTTTTRIVAFRAAHLAFTAQQDWTFTAHAGHAYALTARIGDDHWDLTIDAEPVAHLTSIDVAIDVLIRHHDTAATR